MFFDNTPLYKLPDGVVTRWASPENPKGLKGEGGKEGGGRKGRACFPLHAGETVVLAEEPRSSGVIRRIWMTISERTPEMLRGIKIEFFWDGCEKPAVSAPIGDFFGIGLGRITAFQSALLSNPEGRSFNCFIPMPFRTGMKVTVTNETNTDLRMLFYDIDYTLGDNTGDDTLYFHAYFNRENPTQIKKDYEILPKVKGKGRFLGCNLGVIADKTRYSVSWWGEGEVKMYIDGDTDFPTLCGTGTEDYIGTAWGQGKYDHLFQGCPIADHDNMQYCFYRYHVMDPVYFRSDIRVTIQQLGYFTEQVKPFFLYNEAQLYSARGELIDFSKNGPKTGLFERCDDWSSCAYFYLDRPVSDLPEILPVEQRLIKQVQSVEKKPGLAGE